MQSITTILLILFLQAGLSPAQTNNAIYSTVLQDYVLSEWKTTKKTRLVILDSTSVHCKTFSPPEQYKYPTEDSISFYEFIDTGDYTCHSIQLSDNDFKGINRKIRYHLLPGSTINRYFKQDVKTDRWTYFRKKENVDFGIISFSTIYYSKNGKYACVLLKHGCDRLCGQEMFYTLYFNGRTWKIFNTYITGVS